MGENRVGMDQPHGIQVFLLSGLGWVENKITRFVGGKTTLAIGIVGFGIGGHIPPLPPTGGSIELSTDAVIFDHMRDTPRKHREQNKCRRGGQSTADASGSGSWC